MSTTGTPSVPPPDLPLHQRLQLAQCLSDRSAITVSETTSYGLLVDAASADPVREDTIEAVVRAAAENVERWRRLRTAGDFIADIVMRVSDEQVRRALEFGGMHESPSTERFRTTAAAEGGFSIYLRSRMDRIASELVRGHERALDVYATVARWPDGLAPDGTSPGILTRFDTFGCAIGVADIALGSYAVATAAALEVLTVGGSTPASIALGVVGFGVAADGAVVVASRC